MATKAEPEDVRNLGFNQSMFSALEEVVDFDAFIQEILDENVDEIKEAIGSSVYDDATKLADVIRIEKYLAAADLWNRRANIVLTNRAISGSEGASSSLSESKLEEKYRERAEKIMNRLAGYDNDSPFSMSVEESEH
jgi:hypothetical protein